jgi:hypothetical protein
MTPAGPRPCRGVIWGIVVLTLSIAWTTRATAQWHVEAAAGGVSHEATGGAVSSSSAILGLRREGAIWAYLSSGLPLGGDGLPWAASGVGGRVEGSYRTIELGIDLGAQAHGYRASASGNIGGGLVLDALPFAAAELAGARLEVRSGLAHYSSEFAGETISRTLHESGITAEYRPLRRVELSAEASLLRADEGDYQFIGAAAELALTRASLWAHIGRWTDDAMPDPTWGIGTVVALAPRYALRASYQQEATDPLFWAETRRFWSVGVSRRMGSPVPARLIAPVLPRMSKGGVDFRIPAAGLDAAPSIAGDFNGWTPVPMTRAGDEWVVTIAVSPGVYHYSFRAADGSWFVPESIENRVDDGFGSTNAVLVVPPRNP